MGAFYTPLLRCAPQRDGDYLARDFRLYPIRAGNAVRPLVDGGRPPDLGAVAARQACG
jgi:hypothetical protein